MTLATHIVIAAALTKPLARAHPIFIFLIALASHYLSDAIPHWDYKLSGITTDEYATKQLVSRSDFLKKDFFPKIMLDLFLGSAVVFFVTKPVLPQEFLSLAIAVIGGILPDALQGVYYLFKKPRFMEPFQRLHEGIHTKIKLGPYPLIGIPFQLIILSIAILFLI